MRLQVDAGQLEGFAGQVNRGAEDAREMLDFAAKFTRISGEQGGLLTRAAGEHDAVRDRVLRTLEHLAEVLRESSRELRAASAYYRQTDLRVAADLDTSYARDVRRAGGER